MSVPVTNVGGRDGDAVVQLYARPTQRQPGDAIHSLVGFSRISIPKGETKTVEIAIPRDRLRAWDPAQKRYVVRADTYTFEVGASSADLRGRVKIKV